MSTRWLMTARMPTSSLFDAAREGDPRDVDNLCRAWLPHVYRWCHRMGGPGFDAEDAAHEVLMITVRRLHTVQSREQFPSWLFGVTRRVLANYRRKAWWRRWMPQAVVADRPSDDVGPEQTVVAKRASDRIWKALATLPPKHRDVLVLCELEERSGSEAAALLDIPLGTVKSRLRAARQSLRGALDAQDLARLDTQRAREVR